LSYVCFSVGRMDEGSDTAAALATIDVLRALRLDPARLSEAARIDALVAVQQLHAWADAQQVRLLAAMDVGTELDRDLAATEVGLALRSPPATAHDRLRGAHRRPGEPSAALATDRTSSTGWH
jgi:hypothetical protein